MEHITVALEDYDDLFDDFDRREFDTRAVSSDFLDELWKRFRPDEEHIKLVFTLPKQKRARRAEPIIIRRLNAIFKEKHEHNQRKVAKVKMKGGGFIIGAFILAILGYYTRMDINPVVGDFLWIPSYFFAWYGLESLMFERTKFEKKSVFYKALSHSHIIFEDEIMR